MTEMEQYEFINKLDVQVYNEFRDMVGWGALPTEEAESGITHSHMVISCIDGRKTIGFARLIWDEGYIAFISDVIVHPDYRNKGIASEMINRILTYLEEQKKPGWRIKVSLMAAVGKEAFYEKLGFMRRPNEHGGCGMDKWIF